MEKWLKPKHEGLIVRDPVSMVPLAAEGEWKLWIGPQGRYWRRRVSCGDCIDETAKKQQQDKKKKE